MDNGEFPEWSKGADCKSVGSSFVGPNPSLPKKGADYSASFFYLKFHSKQIDEIEGRFLHRHTTNFRKSIYFFLH